MGAGYLNKYCTFKREMEVRNASGDTLIDFSTISSELLRYPCGYRPERGWERTEAGRDESAEQGTLRVRSCTAIRGVRASDIVTIHERDGDVDYTIKYIDNRDRHDRYAHMQIERGTARK